MAATPITAAVTREHEVIDAARANKAAMAQHEIDQLELAVEWVLLHPGDEVDTSVEWGMRDLEIAGDGAPTIDEGAVAEFALAIGISTDSGRLYLGDAVELRFRLPRIWTRVVAGLVPVWKARKVAQATRSLPPEGAAAVDQAIYFVLKRCSFAEIDRQVEAARQEHDPAEASRRYREALERRHFKVHLGYMTHDGLVPVSGMLDVADAVALDAVVAARADTLDPELPLDVRRAIAAGMLGTGDGDEVPREVVIYAHTRPGQVMVDLENTRSTITPEHLQDWCRRAGTQVTIKPVIDLNEEITTDSYTPTDRQREQARLRHPQCPFPGCTRPSRPGTDTDHVIEWPLGQTTTSNLAPLCRRHHRLKTFTAWTYHWTPGLGWVWTSPLGHRHIG